MQIISLWLHGFHIGPAWFQPWSQAPERRHTRKRSCPHLEVLWSAWRCKAAPLCGPRPQPHPGSLHSPMILHRRTVMMTFLTENPHTWKNLRNPESLKGMCILKNKQACGHGSVRNHIKKFDPELWYKRMTNASSYRCCFLLVCSPPFFSSRNSRPLVSISSTNWTPEKKKHSKTIFTPSPLKSNISFKGWWS